MFPAKEVDPGLWVGSVADITDTTFLRKNNIRLVVNCAAEDIPSHFFSPTVSVRLKDAPESRDDMAKALPKVVAKVIEYRRAGNPVLIHCMAGVSRSATVAAAVLMAEYGYTARQAVQKIQNKKPETFGTRGPNGQPVFWPVLLWWEKVLR